MMEIIDGRVVLTKEASIRDWVDTLYTWCVLKIEFQLHDEIRL